MIGRDEELALLVERVAAAAERGGAVVVEGEAGIGKTTMLRAAAGTARDRGWLVLSSRPAESEARLSHAALGDLLERVVPEALASLTEPARRALEIALRLREATAGPLDPRTVGIAVLNVVRALSRAQPVVVAVDDLQWLDAPSAAALEFAARRLEDERVAVLASVRAESPGDVPFDLERTFAAGRLWRLELGPLGKDEIHRLVRLRLGRTLARPELVRLHAASGGNPFYALEVARSLASRTVAAGEPIPIPARLEELVAGRLAALPPRVRRVVEAAAALAEPTVAAVAAATAGEDAVSAPLEAAQREGVLSLEGERIRFAHPLLAASAYGRMAPPRRRKLHRRLARVVADPEERARHLALGTSGPREDVAEAADEAARTASARGAPGAAVELGELAIRLTPRRRARALRERKLAASRHHLAFGSPARARELLEQLRAELPPGGERADVLRSLAYLSPLDRHARLERLEQALAEAAGDERRLGRVHQGLGEFWFTYGDSRRALAHYREALELAERHRDRDDTVLALTGLVLTECFAACPTPGLLERAASLEREARDPFRAFSLASALALVRLCEGRVDEARALVEGWLREAAALGSEPGRASGCSLLALVEGVAGDLRSAARLAAEACELRTQLAGAGHPWPLFAKALSEARLGLVAEARATAEEGLAIAERAGIFHGRMQHLAVLGFLELSLGDATAADRILRPLLSELLAGGWALAPNPPARDGLEALVSAGELEQARKLIGRFEREAHALASPLLAAAGERLRGLLHEAEGDVPEALAAFDRALAAEEAYGWPFERARTLLARGRVLRRARRRRAARESLHAALASFDELGAVLWAERARDELARVSGRAPVREALTPAEEQVAALVARGHTNNETAAALHLSPHTVEGQLSRIYAKLGIRSRTELAHRLAAGAPDS